MKHNNYFRTPVGRRRGAGRLGNAYDCRIQYTIHIVLLVTITISIYYYIMNISIYFIVYK